MMAETAVENRVCKACGADVRDESLFCYNCGSSIVDTSPTQALTVPANTALEKKTADERPPLRSAASLRKHRRAQNRQPVQIAWEQPEGSPAAFVIATIVLTVGAVVLLILALYLR